jgi:hypothetical protein
MLGCGTHAGEPTILPGDLRSRWKAAPPAQTIPRVSGGPFREWLRSVKGTGPEPGSNFSYSDKLTEIILLGVLAHRFNTRIEWDAKNARPVLPGGTDFDTKTAHGIGTPFQSGFRMMVETPYRLFPLLSSWCSGHAH